jgi:cysteine desulfurase family protein (TIGR01976 family)
MPEVNYPIEQVRAQFPALSRTYKGRQVLYLDGPAGSQMCRGSIEAMTAYMAGGMANTGGRFPTSYETEEMIADARRAVADFFNVSPGEVAFGANMTTLNFAISRALALHWQAGDEVVVSEMDHRGNVDPWLRAAEERGMTVRWLRVDPKTLTLRLDELDSIVNQKTKLVAVGRASNVVGTVNDVEKIGARAREVGALLAVDVVHAAPHIAVDRDALGADILLCSAYKFFGPHIGITAIRSGLFESLRTYKVEPAHNGIPDRLETGTQNHECIAGVEPAIEFIAGLGGGETRRQKIVSGYERIEQYENNLAAMLRTQLPQMPGLHLYQAPVDVRKVPTMVFGLEGKDPEDLAKWMSEEQSIFLGNELSGEEYYASTLARAVGIGERGGWNRIGLAPYNTSGEIERFLGALEQYLSK